MLGRIEIGSHVPFWIGLKPREDPVPPKFSTVVGILKKSSWIGSSIGDGKDEIRRKAAPELLRALTRVVSDQQFYREVSEIQHLQALALLFEHVVPPAGEEFERFMKGEEQPVIETYLVGFVGSAGDRVKVSKRLKTWRVVPSHYAEVVFPKIGL